MAADPPADAEATRRAHLRHESDIKSVGQLCYLVTFVSLLGTLEFLLVSVGVLPYPPEFNRAAGPSVIRAGFGALAGFLALNAVGQAALGYGLIRLQDWARWTVVVLTAISLASCLGLALVGCFLQPAWGLLGLAIVAALHALILYPLLTPSSAEVFSKGYREVIRATPGLRTRMHVLLKLFIGSMVASVVGFLGFLAAIYLRLIDW